MTEPDAKPRRRRFWRYLLLALALGLAGFGGFAWYASTDSFQAMVRERLVRELETVTGGRVELGAFHAVPFHFLVGVSNLTIHGKEAADQLPLVHIDRLEAKIKVLSVLGFEFGFDWIKLDQPVIHLIAYPDGQTNQPEPRTRASSSTNPVQKLFSLSIGRIDVNDGALYVNDRKIPLDFSANDVGARMSYSHLPRRYRGELHVGKAETTYADFRPVAWVLDTQFDLEEKRLQIHDMKVTSGASNLEASGKLEDFADPKFSGNYKTNLNLAEVAAIVHRPELRRGTLEAEGSGSWSKTDFSSDGNLAIKELEIHTPRFPVRSSAASAHYTINPKQLTLSELRIRALGGEVSGAAEATNWQTPAGKFGRGSEPQKVAINLRFKSLQLDELASMLATAARPLDQLRLAGDLNGSLQSHWVGDPGNAETEVSAEVAAPAHFLSQKLPLSVKANVLYRAGPDELEVRKLDAATAATELHAQGVLSTHSAMRFSFRTTDLSEWQAELPGLGYTEQLPVVFQGQASFEGNATGRLSAIQFNGKLDSQNFDMVMPATAQAPQKRIRWDTLESNFQLAPSGVAFHHGTLRRGDTTVAFDATASLHDRQFTRSSAFTARVAVDDANIVSLQHLAGYDYPISGRASFVIEASGTQDAPRGDGHLTVRDATAYGESVPHFESHVEIAGRKITVQDVKMIYDKAPITGSGSCDLTSKEFQFSVKSGDFDLKQFSKLQTPRLTVEGTLNFVASGQGTFDAPSFDGTAYFHDLTLDQEHMGDFALNATTDGSDMHLVGRSSFKDSSLGIDGDVVLRGDYPSDIKLNFTQLDVDSVLRSYLHGKLTGHSSTTGELHMTGPLRKPRQLQVVGDLASFSAEVEHIRVRNSQPISFGVANEVLTIQQLHLTGQDTDLSVTGTVELSGDNLVNLHAKGEANLALMETFDPNFTNSGTVTMDVDVQGLINRPAIQGKVVISNGAVAYNGLSMGLSDVNGSLTFTQDRLQVDTLTAQVGGGTINVGGYVNTYGSQFTYELTLHGKDVRIRPMQGVSSVANLDLRFAGRASSATLSGEAVITRFAIAPGFDISTYSGLTQTALSPTSPLLNQIHLDVHIVTLPELQFQTNSARLSGEADLRVRGTAAKPVVLGRADIVDGQVEFNGAKFRIERGEVTFTNPVTTTPVLDLQASTRVRYYDITININGGFDKLNLNYHSEPPLASADIISLLALGQTREEAAQLQSSGQQSVASMASSAALADALNSALSNRSRSLFGISHIRIDPQGLNTTTSPTTTAPAVTVEQQVKDNLTLTYTTDVSQTSQQIIQAEYQISKTFSILALRDYNGVVSFELQVRQRKK
ncbi:MAG TPA: translocation/assembly module TamB domain-containing protein [Terriglobales bacterium]